MIFPFFEQLWRFWILTKWNNLRQTFQKLKTYKICKSNEEFRNIYCQMPGISFAASSISLLPKACCPMFRMQKSENPEEFIWLCSRGRTNESSSSSELLEIIVVHSLVIYFRIILVDLLIIKQIKWLDILMMNIIIMKYILSESK